MDHPLLLPSTSSTPLLFSPFPQILLRCRRNPRRPSALRPHRRRISASISLSLESDGPSDPSVFGAPRELSGPQVLVDALPPPARTAASVALATAAAAAGFGLGVRFGASRVAGIGGAALFGALGGAAAFALNASAPEVAAVSLHNLVAGFDDPAALTKDDVEGIVQKYGVSKDNEAFRAELCYLYNRFVSSVLPPGGEDLKGNEVESIIKFKEALGIDDPDAASVHMEIGRRIYRERMETGDREADFEQRRAFQKLIYVSALVFGEASKFLLPWKRIFKVTDSQVEIAIKDNAQRLYASKLKLISRDIEQKHLIDLRESQLLYRLSDEIAAEMFRESTRKLVEENISTALHLLKSRTGAVGTVQVVAELEKVLTFNDLLKRLSEHPESGRFAPGVGLVSLSGGEYDSDRKMDDLKLLYKAYVEESFPNGRFEEKKLVALNHLKNIFLLGNRQAEAIVLEVTCKIYRRRLSQAFSSGDIEAAPSKAAFLQNLCDELYFDPQKASAIHEEIYRQKLQRSVVNGALDAEDVAALGRLRVLLCIPQNIVDAAHADICGKLFEKVVRDAIASGVDGYDADVRASVRKASQGLHLTRDAAMDIASKAVRKVLLSYIQRSRSAGDRVAGAKELKKMIAFNTLVVTQLISDIKGDPMTASAEAEPDADESKEDDEEEWESLQTLRKTRPDKELQEKLVKPGQTEITLKDDLPERNRADLYRTYLLFCLSGEVTVVPFGGQITTKRDNTEFLLLRQLGEILGLTGKEIVEIHRSLAEQAFTKQAEVILADGQLNKARIEQLNEAQKEVGLPAEYAQKVIKNITTNKISSSIETAVSRGMIGIQQIRELKEAKIDLDSMISVRLRENLFKKIVEDIFSSGTGVFEEHEVYEKIPADLSIDAEKAKGVVLEIAKNRLSNSLVQAVAMLRQRNWDGVVSSLNDMLACDVAVSSDQPLSWSPAEELADIYCVYIKGSKKQENLSRLQYLLGISDDTAALLQQRQMPTEEREDEFVF